jgi:hypothetical protein
LKTLRDTAVTVVPALWALVIWRVYVDYSDVLAYTLGGLTFAIWFVTSLDLADRETGRSTPLVPRSMEGDQ